MFFTLFQIPMAFLLLYKKKKTLYNLSDCLHGNGFKSKIIE